VSRRTPSTRIPSVRTPFFAAIGVAVALSTTACSSDEAAERIIESQLGEGADIEIDTDSGDIQIQTDEGSLSSTSSADLPDDFPADIPTPEGTLMNSSRIESDGNVVFTLLYNQAGAVTESVYAAYEASLNALGYETTFESVGGGAVTAQISDGTTLVTFNGGDIESGAEYQVIVAPVAE
jgi:hypothetical protein